MKLTSILFFVGCATLQGATPEELATTAVNGFALDLYRAEASGPSGNILFSPFSIQQALAMVYAGANGETRAEMQRVLHYTAADNQVHVGFGELNEAFKAVAHSTQEQSDSTSSSKSGDPKPFEFETANGLFVQQGWQIRPSFAALIKKSYKCEPENYDFRQEPDRTRTKINLWTQERTHDRIKNIVREGALNNDTRMVLANAIYFRARWEEPFDRTLTDLRDFWVNGTDKKAVPTMTTEALSGYQKHKNYTVLTLPYENKLFQLVIILPHARTSLATVEKSLSVSELAACKDTPIQEVHIFLPKLTIDQEALPLKSLLMNMGIKSAFDEPKGSANFDGICERKPNDYLSLSEVFHKTWFALDEKETEAAASTVGTMTTLGVVERKVKPPEVHVDHPFIFAIQHIKSGAYLFFGRVTDPR